MYNKRYIITAAQFGATPKQAFLDNLDLLAKREKAEVLILPMDGCYKSDELLHPYFEKYRKITGTFKMNKNIQIISPSVKPQQIDPITGLGRHAQDDCSSIFASPKQRMKPYPNGHNELPKIIMTTGACTKPYYKSHTRMGRIALKDHVYGAIIVEIANDKFYQYRHLTAQENGVFYDICDRVGDGVIKRERPLAIRPGDWHTGMTDPDVRAEWMKVFKKYSPEYVFFEDFMDSKSINHHEDGKLIEKIRTMNTRGLSLENEIYELACELKTFAETFPNTEFVIIKSNHDEHLHRYLTEGRFLREPHNAYIASKLLTAVLDGHDPIIAGIELFYEIPSNVRFLKRDEDFKLKGVQMANHGDLSFNGARGGRAALEIANGNCIVGHGHSPEIFRNVMAIGTATYLTPDKVGYNTGYSSWMNTGAFLYHNGKKQLVNIINGKHRF